MTHEPRDPSYRWWELTSPDIPHHVTARRMTVWAWTATLVIGGLGLAAGAFTPLFGLGLGAAVVTMVNWSSMRTPTDGNE